MFDFTFKESGKLRDYLSNSDFWAPLVLVVLGVLFFADLLFSSKNFYFRDILNFHYPLRRVLIDSYARGELPLWNPFIYFGQPMLANPNYMAFYPTNLLHLLLSFNYAFKLHFILHPLAAGLGLYFFQRRLGMASIISLAGAIVYEFSGTVLSFLNLYNIVPAVALLPWIAWAFLGALKENWLRRSLLFGALLGLQVIAFEPLTFQCNLLFLAGLSLYWIFESQDKIKSATTILRVGLLGAAFGLGLAGVQLIPTLEMLPHSARGAGLDFAALSYWSVHPMDLVNASVPNLYGYLYTMGHSTSWGDSFHEGREGYLVSFFLGTCVLLLACLSFLTVRKNLQRILTGLAALSVGLSLGRFDPVYHWLVTHVPLFRLGRYPSKYFLLATLTISLMSSLGFETLLSPGESVRYRKQRILAIGSTGILAALAFLGCFVYWQSHPQILESWLRKEVAPGLASAKDFPVIVSQLLRSLLASGAFLLTCSGLVLASQLKKMSVSLLGGLVIILLTAELIPANLRLSPLISDADVDFVPEVNNYVARNGPAEPYRVFPPTSTLLQPMPALEVRAPNRAAAWLTLFYRRTGQPFYGIMEGIQYSVDRSVDQLNTEDSEELWTAFLRLTEPEALTLFEKLNTPMLLSISDVRDPRVQLIIMFDTQSSVQLRLYWLNNTMARAFFVSDVQYAPTHRRALEIYLKPDFPFGDTVVLENPRGINKPGETGVGSVRLLDYKNQRALCEVQAQVPGYLVLLDSYYPGWHAYVDGSEAEILRANFAFRAVAVSAGKHRVEFRFRPFSFYLGLTMTVFSALTGIALMNFCSRNSL